MSSLRSRDGEQSTAFVSVIAISIFAVLTHWGAWDSGVFSMGWNTSVVWLSLGALLIRANDQIKLSYDWVWLLPLALLAVSFGLYENPWLKALCFLLMPITVGIFFSFGHVNGKDQFIWDGVFISQLVLMAFKVLPVVPTAFAVIRNTFFSKFGSDNLTVFKRVSRALIILLPLMFVVLLLLSSADDNFDSMVNSWFDHFAKFLDWSIAAKIFFVVLVSSVLLAVLTSLRQPLTLEQNFQTRKVDGLVASIVLIAILVIYMAFLSLQIDYLLLESLPIEFADTERLVKSGFWQLFILSVINVVLFYWVYKNTGSFAQWILRLYLIASALILISAAWRMGLYVFYYGFSYEKFFASYTTLYALFLFGFLGWAVFAKSRKDIVKTLCISSLWVFSIANILPVERIIFSSNIALSQRDDSRIDLLQLNHLSSDVLGVAMQSFNDRKFSNGEAWSSWLRRSVAKNCSRPWYETNLSLALNCSSVSMDDLAVRNWKSD